jgi:hypothetical protein
MPNFAQYSCWLEGAKAQRAGEVLGASLLSAEMQAILREGEVEDALAGLEQLFGALSPVFTGLAAVYAEKGLREVERILTQRYLAVVIALPLHPVLRGVFTRVSDSRNILALYKALRTGGTEAGLFLSGGIVPVERLTVLLEKEIILEVSGLVRQAAGVRIASAEPTQVEVALYAVPAGCGKGPARRGAHPGLSVAVPARGHEPEHAACGEGPGAGRGSGGIGGIIRKRTLPRRHGDTEEG